MSESLWEIARENSPIYSTGELKVLYSRGYYLYETGNFLRAIEMFQELITIDPLYFPYWQGFSASLQMNRQYHRAIHGWSVFIHLEPNRLLPYLHLAECLISMHAIAHALQVLQSAKRLAWNSNNLEDIKLRNQITLLETRWSS